MDEPALGEPRICRKCLLLKPILFAMVSLDLLPNVLLLCVYVGVFCVCHFIIMTMIENMAVYAIFFVCYLFVVTPRLPDIMRRLAYTAVPAFVGILLNRPKGLYPYLAARQVAAVVCFASGSIWTSLSPLVLCIFGRMAIENVLIVFTTIWVFFVVASSQMKLIHDFLAHLTAVHPTCAQPVHGQHVRAKFAQHADSLGDNETAMLLYGPDGDYVLRPICFGVLYVTDLIAPELDFDVDLYLLAQICMFLLWALVKVICQPGSWSLVCDVLLGQQEQHVQPEVAAQAAAAAA